MPQASSRLTALAGAVVSPTMVTEIDAIEPANVATSFVGIKVLAIDVVGQPKHGRRPLGGFC